MDEPRDRIPPSIDLKPEPVETGEGEVAKFMVKVSGYPRPRVNWWVNGTVIMGVSMFEVIFKVITGQGNEFCLSVQI